MTTKVQSTTKTCGRCLGTGKHSYNLKDGDVCYGCGGSGQIAVAPKGQKKVKPTCDSEAKAVVGDIIEINCILYKVEKITWIEYTLVGKHYLTQKQYNQKMILTKLVDGKTCRTFRCKAGPDGYAIKPTPEMIGQEA